MLIIKKIIIVHAILALFSCSSAPPFLSPSKALVKTSVVKMGKNVPLKYNEFLNNTKRENNIIVAGQKIVLGELYTSALGQQCRILYVSERTQSSSMPDGDKVISRKRIVCKQAQQDLWVLIPAIVEQVNKKTIFAD